VGRMKRLSKRLDVFLEEVVEEHDKRRKAVENYVAKDMLDVLLQQADDPQLKLSRVRVKAFTQDIIAGGTESSATLVEWGLSELLKKPETFERATEELDRVVGRERWVEEKDIGGLEYMQWIVKETMRLHPVAPMLVPRLSTQPCRIAGYDIPANTRLFVNVWTIGRDGKLWENPDKFQPERFKGSTLDVKGRDYELLPFGSGRRMCPGYSLGLKVVQIALANLIHGFQWKLPATPVAALQLSLALLPLAALAFRTPTCVGALHSSSTGGQPSGSDRLRVLRLDRLQTSDLRRMFRSSARPSAIHLACA